MALGLDADLFWRLTPRELQIQFAGAQRRLAREHNADAWLAWHVAVLGRQRKITKRDLERLMMRERREAQDWRQQMAIARAWTLALGGTITTRKH